MRSTRTSATVVALSWLALSAAAGERPPDDARPCSPTREAYAPWAFFGYACESDCAEQKAGFAWAERNGVSAVPLCNAQSGGYRDGCRAYAEAAVTGEQAGFEWARENEVTEPCACLGAGPAFASGCEAYLGETRD